MTQPQCLNNIINPKKVNSSPPPPAAGILVGAGQGGGYSLPCLNSNNYTEQSLFTPSDLTPYHRKQAFALIENCDRFIENVGINYVGFLTLTFPDNVVDHSEALRRWNSLRTHFIDRYFGKWMLVKERQKRGSIHYHILIQVPFDIRTGFDFDEVFPGKGKRAKYGSASKELKMMWQELRSAMPKYGFGRSELAPIRTNGEAMAKYVGKYIAKNSIHQKRTNFDDLDKGARMISYSQNWSRSSTKFSWNSDGAKEWRKKLQRFTQEYIGVETTEDLKTEFGNKWAYKCAGMIDRINIYYDLQKCDQYRADRDHYLTIYEKEELKELYGDHWELILCTEIASFQSINQEALFESSKTDTKTGNQIKFTGSMARIETRNTSHPNV